MTRRNGLLLGIGAAVLAALLLSYALSQTTLTYLLPSPEGIIRRTAIFRPALVASIVNGVALVASLGALVWHLVGRPPRWAWWAVAVLLAAGVVADVVVLSSARPLF